MNNEKIFMGGYIMCNNTRCLKDCEGRIFISKEWFENNFAEVTGFKDKENFFFNYLNEDIEKLIYKAIEDEVEFKLEQPECPCFKGKEIFKKHRGKYGYLRITMDLNNKGYKINKKKVQRIM